jgi:hypothetical protein
VHYPLAFDRSERFKLKLGMYLLGPSLAAAVIAERRVPGKTIATQSVGWGVKMRARVGAGGMVTFLSILRETDS